jgi:hypothetical protein
MELVKQFGDIYEKTDNYKLLTNEIAALRKKEKDVLLI